MSSASFSAHSQQIRAHSRILRQADLQDDPRRRHPESQAQVQSSNASGVRSARSLGQIRRWQRYREQQGQQAGASRERSNRSVAQQLRRARERAARNGPAPPSSVTDPVPPQPAPVRQILPLPRPRRRVHPRKGDARAPYRDPPARFTFGRMDVVCRYCNAKHWLDEHTAGSNDSEPKFGTCCDSGKVKLPLLQEPPPRLKALFTGTDQQARDFMLNIRQYNAALAFVSLGVDIDDSVNRGNGPYIFKIGGALYHRAGSLLPPEGRPPSYAQLYIYDPQVALAHRTERNSNLRPDTMALLQDTIFESHHYTRVYKHAFEIATTYGDIDVDIAIVADPTRDSRRYNLPIVDEIAAIIPGDGNEVRDARDIILTKRNGALRRISEGHPAYACLHYVLLFPWGERGWSWDLRMADLNKKTGQPRRLTQARYYAYQMQVRDNEFSTILRGGRLFQQYAVDVWAATDQNRLNYVRQNQAEVRADLYSGLLDAVHEADGNVDLNEVGRRYVLPSSHVGSPRYMYQCFQDAMALARYYRKIDLFVTVTCNPEWPEIQAELLPGQTAADRPDLVARVFALYRDQIIDDIYKHGILGEAVAHVHTIEFQKRGLPHMHLLIFLKHPWRISSAADVDTVVRAYWPDPATEPLLFETIKRCMVHGPCGAANPNAPCMKDGRCSKKFPKAFQEETTMNADGYPNYKRPNDGRAYEVRGVMLDNRWIVPYNAYMSARYNCHINVECCVSVAATKYITKYTHKGPDRATVSVTDGDEIQKFIDSRYISAPEALWRIFMYDIHRQTPNIVRLPVHEPGRHMVVYDPSEPVEVVLARGARERTMLTEFFKANADPGPRGAVARRLTYQEFPQGLVWDTERKTWRVRQHMFAIGRMVFVPPCAGDRFYLRTLLTVQKGATSYQDLCTVNGVCHFPDYRAACLALGLLEDDGEWRQCLQEACAMQTGTRLRHLFAIILDQCRPNRPELLWAQFREHICDDLPRRLQRLGIAHPSAEDVYDYGLYLLDAELRKLNRELADFTSMPRPQRDWTEHAVNNFLAQQLDYDRDAEREAAERMTYQLNEDQRYAFERILGSVEAADGQHFFLHGPGGTGKTFVYRTLCHHLRSLGLIVLCVASSGIAALILPGGRTSHSTFKIPIENLSDVSTCSMNKTSALAEVMRMVRLIIWDEAVMQHRYGPEAVDRTLRDLRGENRPFGGVTVVFGGDFQQILPVVVKGSREDTIQASLRRSYLWDSIETLHLRQNMRLQDDADAASFARWLLDVGHGRADTITVNEQRLTKLPPSMLCNSEDALIERVYAGIDADPTSPPPPEFFLHRTILAPKNDDVDSLNERILERFPGEERTYLSADSYDQEAGADGMPDEALDLPIELLHSLSPAGVPLSHLRVKVGCPLILLRNLAASRGLCNGSRMVVRRMSHRVLEVQLIGGDHHGEIELIPRITLTPAFSHAEVAFRLKRRQFPVRLAFAMTVNKAQGQSVKYVGLDLRHPVFAHGQLYVALSRATSSRNIHILLSEEERAVAATKNVVYPEVLLPD